jgi:hypothetical protein
MLKIIALIIGLLLLFVSLSPAIMIENDFLEEDRERSIDMESVYFFKNIRGKFNSLHEIGILHAIDYFLSLIFLHSDGDSIPYVSLYCHIDTRGKFRIDSEEFYYKHYHVFGFIGKIIRRGNDPLRSSVIIDGLSLITIIE